VPYDKLISLHQSQYKPTAANKHVGSNVDKINGATTLNLFNLNTFNPTGQNCDCNFFLISGSSKNVVIDFGQEMQLTKYLNDNI